MKKISREESEIKAITRKSLVAAMDIPAGAIITDTMIDLKRPGSGLAPKNKDKVIGRISNRLIKKNELFDWDMME
jgi:sialic acid synthase SpsE